VDGDKNERRSEILGEGLSCVFDRGEKEGLNVFVRGEMILELRELMDSGFFLWINILESGE